MDELADFERSFPNEPDSIAWVKSDPSRFYVPFLKIFMDFSTKPDILPMRYLDQRVTADKDLLRGLTIEDDMDTVKRSAVIVHGSQRLYYKPTLDENAQTASQQTVKKSCAVLSLKKSKFSVCVGVRFDDLSENTSHCIHSIFEQVNEKGTSVPHFKIQTLEDDDGNDIVCRDRYHSTDF